MSQVAVLVVVAAPHAVVAKPPSRSERDWYCAVVPVGQLVALAVQVVVLPTVEVVTVGAAAVPMGRTTLLVPLATQPLELPPLTQRACCWNVYCQPSDAATDRGVPVV